MRNILLLIPILLLLSCSTNPEVEIRTSEGNIVVEVFEKEAPVTASNFLKLVDEGIYDGAVFYRVVTKGNQSERSIKIEVIQGGLFHDESIDALKPIAHETTKETGIMHKNGTISMARLEPGTASSEFFICVGDQPELNYGGKRNEDGQGFAAFGKVVKGMEVVERIHSLKNSNQMLDDMILIKSIQRV